MGLQIGSVWGRSLRLTFTKESIMFSLILRDPKVGHLVQEHQPLLLVYNYAKNGHTVIGVKNQVTSLFMRDNPPVVPWNAENSLFGGYF